jgi:D-beta-D-heptose 7-phosphate kinase / D-beta-D-heptose 1-phosphate adenosyltransferase
MQQILHPTAPIELVRRFSHLRALVIGDIMLDTYVEGDASRLCKEGPVPVVHKTQEMEIPGGAANTAANLRALGATVELVGVVGHDHAGERLRASLQQHNIHTQWLIEDTQAPTQHKLRILADGQYIVRLDEGNSKQGHTSPYTEKTQRQLSHHIQTLYPHCEAVIISDYCYGVLCDEIIAQLRELQATHPATLLVDSKALWRFRDVPITVVTPNQQEAQDLLQEEPQQHVSAIRNPLDDVDSMAQQLAHGLSTQYVAITMAEQGVALFQSEPASSQRSLHIPAHPVAHANDVGAGDSFAAALALALAAGSDIEQATRIAIDAAGIAITKAYTAIVQQHELLQRVSLRVYTEQAHSLQHNGGNAQEHVITQIEVERLLGHTIVLTNGVFDILHAGHVEFLKQAKALGDTLVVAINSDKSTRRIKRNGRPINNEQDRLALVAVLDMVDYVMIFDEDTPSEIIRRVRPHIHVKGGDYAAEALPEAAAVQEVGGRVVILPLVGNTSTSQIIERIVSNPAISRHHHTQQYGIRTIPETGNHAKEGNR